MGSFGLFTQLSGSLLKVNEWFLPPWKLACTPSWMSPQNASSESSSSKHEELLKPSPEKKDTKFLSTRTWTHKSFWFVFQFSLFFNLTLFSPLAVPILDRIGFHFLKLRKLTFLYPPSMLFFTHRESVGTPLVTYLFSSWGDAFTKKVLYFSDTLLKWFWVLIFS